MSEKDALRQLKDLLASEKVKAEEDKKSLERVASNTVAVEFIVENLEAKLNNVLEYIRTSKTGYARPVVDISQKADPTPLLCGWVFCRDQGKKKWDRKYFVLQGGFLYSFADELMQSEKGFIPLDSCRVGRPQEREDSDRPCVAIEVDGGRTVYFDSESQKDNMSWYLALNCMQQQVDYINKQKASGRTPDPRIVNFFTEPNCHQLVLDNNELPSEAIVAILSSIRFHTVLHSLSLQNTSLHDAEVEILSRALARNKSIVLLKLSANVIGDVGAKHLSDAIKGNSSIRELYLEQNQIGDAGAVSLSEMITEHRPFLDVFDINYNRIGDVGMAALCTAFGNPGTRLVSLSFSHNLIGNIGASAVADLLVINKSIRVVDLSYNQIQDDGVISLAKALPRTELAVLMLSGNTYTKAATLSLTRGVMDNTSLVYFALSPLILDEAALFWLRLLHGAHL